MRSASRIDGDETAAHPGRGHGVSQAAPARTLRGTTTARELDALLRRHARQPGAGLDICYTNTEGESVSAIFKADRAGVDSVLFNPAGFLHAGHALRDCLKSIRAPAIEIHMTNIEKRGYGSVTARPRSA